MQRNSPPHPGPRRGTRKPRGDGVPGERVDADAAEDVGHGDEHEAGV
jgi:hypothetical protein